MMKDADGIIWTGTSLGLLTSSQLVGYNGYTRYPQLNNVIKDIQQDNLHRLWLKTQSNKYMVYTPRTNELIPDARAYLQEKGLDVRGDLRVEIDTYGKVWVSAGNHIWIYDCKTGFKKTLTLPRNTGQVIGVETDKKGVVIVTQGAVYLTSSQVEKIHPRFYAKTDGWKSTEKILIDRAPDNTIWLYSDLRLASLNPNDKKWTWHREVQPDVTCILRPDGGDYLMVGTTNNGIYVLDKAGKLVKQIYKDLPVDDGIANNHIESLYYNPENRALAVAYHKHNLSIFNLTPQQFRNHHVQSPANMFLQEDVISFGGADANSVWLGTEDNGIYRVKTAQGR